MRDPSVSLANVGSGDFFQEILEALPTPVLALGEDQRICFTNSAFSAFVDKAPEGLIQQGAEAVFGAGSAILDLFAKASLGAGAISARSLDWKIPGRSDIEQVDVDIAMAENARLVVGVFHLQRAGHARNWAAGGYAGFARALAHEVRNPLAGIKGAAQLIARSVTGETRRFTDLICEETDRIRRLTDRVDALEPARPLMLEPLNIHEALDHVRAIVESAHPDIATSRLFDPSLPLVLADRDAIVQALLNLAVNAADAARAAPDQSGRIVFATRFRAGETVRLRLGARSMALVEACLIDNGPGVPGEAMARLGEPFFTTKPAGGGLGLAVAREIAGRHNGRLEWESQPGRTVFRLLLPAFAASDAGAEA